MNVYTKMGYKDREEYLCVLADSYGLPVDTVFALADMLGKNEDFDGLISGLDEFCDDWNYDISCDIKVM
jgi:hypothetical protein